LSDQHRFFRARQELRTGGRRDITSRNHTLFLSIPGEWYHRLRAQPSPLVVKRNHRSGARWAWTRYNSHRRLLLLASHITPRVSTTARLRLPPRSLLFRCPACWPSSAGQAPCTVDTAVRLDGTLGSHHSTQHSPKRMSQSVVPILCQSPWKRGPGQSPLFFPFSSTAVDAHNRVMPRHETIYAMCMK
jgi:hypothetical protein